MTGIFGGLLASDAVPVIAIYTIGAAGAVGTDAQNGFSGGTTTFSLWGTTLTAGGGQGGFYNTGATSTGGTASGGTTNSTGGAGGGASGDAGGGGGGGIGGVPGSSSSGGEGGIGAQATYLTGLSTALGALGYPTSGPGAGASYIGGCISNGGSATGVGCGGGGANWYGGNGGAGYLGGGGAGAAGYTCTNQTGGLGGSGIIIIERVTASVTVREALTSGSSASYTIPSGTTSLTVWAIGGGGGGAGSTNNDNTSGGAGAAGGTVLCAWTF